MIFSGFFGWGFSRPSLASLDQSMLREDERSKFKHHLSTAPEANQKYLKFLTLPPPFFLFTSSPLLCYVAVRNLCIYFCCYLIIIIIIIYCFRTRFALFLRMSSSKDKSLNTLMWQILSFAPTDRSTSGAEFFAHFWVLWWFIFRKKREHIPCYLCHNI